MRHLWVAGTHDNETAEGWWAGSAGKQDRAFLRAYLDLEEVHDFAGLLIRESMRSVSKTCIFMLQVG